MSETASSVHRLEKLSDFQRFFHTRTYIKNKSDSFKNEKELMRECGYANLNKFRIHRKAWDNLERPIPRKYLQGIGVSLETLQFAVELDQEEFEKALSLPFSPTKAVIRVMPTIYSTVQLPESMGEEEAISALKEMSKKIGKYCFINFGSLKTVFAEPDGLMFTKYYRPTIEIRSDLIIASQDGAVIGKVNLK
jgi:hypothetical protein